MTSPSKDDLARIVPDTLTARAALHEVLRVARYYFPKSDGGHISIFAREALAALGDPEGGSDAAHGEQVARTRDRLAALDEEKPRE